MSVLTSRAIKLAPSAAASTVVTAGASWVYGSWVSFIASTAAPTTVVGFTVFPNSSWNGAFLELDVGYGAAASEVEIGSIPMYLGNDGNYDFGPVFFPVPLQAVAAGQRIAVRARSQTGSFAIAVTLLYIENYDSDLQATGVPSYVPFGALPANPVVNTTAWANGNWLEVVASTSIDDEIVGGVFLLWVTNCAQEFDVGLGAAGVEVVKHTFRMSQLTAANVDGPSQYLQPCPVPIPVPAGSRISVRVRQQLTSATNRNIWLLTSGGSVVIIPTTVVVTQLYALVAYDEDADIDEPPAVTDCSGSGTVAAGTDPSAGTSLSTATIPLAYVEITPIGGSTYRYATVGIPHGTMKYARVLEMGRVKRVLADADHGYEAAHITTRLDDSDGALRALGSTLKGALVDYFISDLATLKAGGTARRRFRGVVDEWRAEANRAFSITALDALTARLTSIDADDLQVPVNLIDSNISDQNPVERMFDKPAPEPYGSLSDEAEDEPEGVWEFKHVGNLSIPGYEDLGNAPLFLCSIGAVKKIQSVYGADLLSGDPPTARIKLGASAFGDWRTDSEAFLLVPKMTGWPFGVDYSAFGGKYYTLLIAKDGHPVVKLAMENRIPFVGNLCARESTGDTTGTLFSVGPWQLLHWINNLLQQSTTTWAALATFGDYSMFNRASFATVATFCEAQGYVNAGVVGDDYQQRTWRDPVSDWLRSFGGDIGIDADGRTMLNKLLAWAGGAVFAYTTQHIHDGTVVIDQKHDAVENTVRYVYAKHYKGALPDVTPEEGSRLFRDPYDGRWVSGLQTVANASSISTLGGDPKGVRRSQVQEYAFTRDQATADAIAAERLDLRAPAGGRAEVTFEVLLKYACDRELGDLVTVEHWDLPWTGSRHCQIRAIEDDFDEMCTRLTVRDVHDLLLITVGGSSVTVGGDPVYAA